MRDIGNTMFPQNCDNCCEFRFINFDDGAEFFGEEGTEGGKGALLRYLWIRRLCSRLG